MISEQSMPDRDKDAFKKTHWSDKKYEGTDIPYPTNGRILFETLWFEFFVYGDYRINDRFL